MTAPEDSARARLAALEAEAGELRRRLATSEEQLAHTDKLKALGTLISGVAHELANPLTAMIARASLIATSTSLEQARAHARIIEAQGRRATQIVRNLSSFARRRPEARGPVSLNDIVRAVVELHGYQLAASQVKLVQELEPQLLAVAADAHEMEQVVLNLVLNAQHAMVEAHGGGQLTLRTCNAGDEVRLEVADDGPGIPPDIAAEMFKPFFSTKGEAGTGLGLAIVKDLVTRHGGRIEPRSTPGGGATMVITLPRLAEPASVPTTATDARASAPAPGHRGRLLVVDDERDIGELVAHLVRRRGWEVVCAGSGEEALRCLRQSPNFAGVLTDLRMPGMDGAALWEALRRERPELARRTIFMTGDHAKPETAALVEATMRPCLTKPFRAEELDEILAGLGRG